MSIPGAYISDFSPLWAELGNTLGVYIIEQGLPPCIILHTRLEGFPGAARSVFNALKQFHDSLEEVYKLFPLEVFFEDLVPPEAIPLPDPEPMPELIFIGRAIKPRQWSFPDYAPHIYKLIG